MLLNIQKVESLDQSVYLEGRARLLLKSVTRETDRDIIVKSGGRLLQGESIEFARSWCFESENLYKKKKNGVIGGWLCALS